MNKHDDNKDFIAGSMSAAIPKMQYEMVTAVLNKAVYGIVSSADSDCLLSAIVMLEHALDNFKILSKSQFSNIVNLYNRTVYEANA